MTYGAKCSGGSGSFPHRDNSASASASAPWAVFNQCNLGQELSVLANQKGIGDRWWACDWRWWYYFCNCKLLSRTLVLPATAAAVWGDRIFTPAVGVALWGSNAQSIHWGGTTARSEVAQQAAVCHGGPKLLRTASHFKSKDRSFLSLLIFYLFFFFKVKEKSDERCMHHSLSSQIVVLWACKYHSGKAKLIL